MTISRTGRSSSRKNAAASRQGGLSKSGKGSGACCDVVDRDAPSRNELDVLFEQRGDHPTPTLVLEPPALGRPDATSDEQSNAVDVDRGHPDEGGRFEESALVDGIGRDHDALFVDDGPRRVDLPDGSNNYDVDADPGPDPGLVHRNANFAVRTVISSPSTLRRTVRRRLIRSTSPAVAAEFDPVADPELVFHDDDRAADVIADDVLGDDRDAGHERREEQDDGVQLERDQG